MHVTKDEIINPNIDLYINPWIPSNHIGKLPQPLRRFLGNRSKPQEEPPLIVQYIVTFFASVAGICFVGGVFAYGTAIAQTHPPALIASLGASAILDYNTIRSPLAQPRNAVVGNTLSAIIGTAISKGFQRFAIFPRIQWVSGAFGCALSSIVMSLTGTVHPPGGATAVIASVEASVVDMGWLYVALVLLASCMMQVVALLFNNVFRQYPVYWWTPESCGKALRKKRADEKNAREDEEKTIGGEEEEGEEDGKLRQHSKNSAPESEADSEATLRRAQSGVSSLHHNTNSIIITPHHINVPDHVQLSRFEIRTLEEIQQRLELERPQPTHDIEE